MLTFRKIPAFLVATGILFILVLKTFIRPNWTDAPDSICFLMGIFPNLYGSFLLPIGVVMLERPLFFLHQRSSMALFCCSCMAALVANEYLQLVPVFLRTFDYNDITASFTGLLSGYLITLRVFIPSEFRIFSRRISEPLPVYKTNAAHHRP